MSINQKSGGQTFRRRFVSGSVFVSPYPPEGYLKSETEIEPDQVKVFKEMLQALPFSLPAVFRSLTFSLLPCFFRFSFTFFAHLH